MKIVIFSTGYIELVIEMANSLADSQEVVLMIPSNSDYQTESYQLQTISSKVKFEPFYMPRMRYPTSLLMLGRVLKSILLHNPDVIHIQDHGHPWFFAIFPLLKKYPLVNTIHDPKPHIGDKLVKGRFAENAAKLFTNHYIVHGKKIKDDLQKLYCVNENKISVVPFGAPISYRNLDIATYPEIKSTVLFFGRIWKYKGLEYLIKAEPYIRKEIKDIKIVIAGHGEDFTKYKRLIHNRDSFIIKNYRIPESEKMKLFQNASVVVLPYIEATQTGIIPHAYMFKKPVIATDVGSFSDVLENGKEGFLIPPGDIKAIANSIIKILKDDKLRRDMGSNAYQRLSTDLSWDHIAQLNLEVYEKAIKAKTG